MEHTIKHGKFTTHQWYALTREIIFVAKVIQVNYWTAYVGIVPGRNHAEEWQEVERTGDRLNERVAALCFPDIAQGREFTRSDG